MPLKDYIILQKTGHLPDVNTVNGFIMTTVLEETRRIKTHETPSTPNVWETDLECLERIAGDSGGEVFSGSDLTFNVIGANRTAMEYPTGPNNTIEVNFHAIHAVTEDRLKKTRNSRLKKLDVPFMRAVEIGDTAKQAAIGQKKQALRDLPPLVTANLTSNSTLNVANTITRQLRILDYAPDELGEDFIVEFTS